MTRLGGLAWFFCACLMSVSTARADNDNFRDSAKRRFIEGKVEFDAKRYGPALDLFKQSYAIAPYPDLLFNIGRCQEELGQTADAIDTYQRYLAVHPEAEVRTKIVALRKKLASEPSKPVVPEPVVPAPMPAPVDDPVIAPVPVAVVALPAPKPRPPVSKRLELWVPVGVGLAILGVSLGLGFGLQSSTRSFPPLTAMTP